MSHLIRKRNRKISADSKTTEPETKKILPKDLPNRSLENGCIIIDDSVTDEDLKKINLQD